MTARTKARSSASISLPCPPQWGTPRTPSRPTLGPRVAEVAAALGKPLMPHQRYVADVALEVDPETGLLVYREITLVINRQQGKTELMLPVMVHRANGFAGDAEQQIRYAAQDGIEARRKWLEVHVPRLEKSPYRRQFHTRRRTSAEAILWRSGAVHAPIAGTARKAGTSDSVDLAIVDEAWVHDDTRMEQGLRPTMLTRRQPQMWIVSMVPGPSRAKTTKSTYLRGKMATGRDLVEAGVNHGRCYFEWSAPRRVNGQRVNAGDPTVWRSCMPALGHRFPDGGGVTEDAVRADYESMALADFCAEYLGWWPDETSEGWQVITEAEWEAAKRPDATIRGQLALGVWVHPDRGWAAIGAAGRTDRGRRLIEITGDKQHGRDYRQGIGWVIPRLKVLDERHEPLAIVTNDRTIADQAADAGLQVHRASAGDEASAAGALFDGIAGAAVEGRDVRHVGQLMLTSAMAAVAKRSQGQWWVWDRAEEDVDIAPVPAVSLALWALMTPRVHIERPKPPGRTRMRWM